MSAPLFPPPSVYDTPRSTAEACAAAIVESLTHAVTERGAASLAVSGGATPGLLFDALAQSAVDWARVHLFFVDERAVPPEDERSNFRLARERLIEPGGLPLENVHRVRTELEPPRAAADYADTIARVLGNGQSAPAIDVVQHGMGADGHTASLFPGDRLVEDREQWTAGVYVPKLDSWRITLLPGILLAARRSLLLVTGADKSRTLARVLSSPAEPIVFPVQVLASRRTPAEWYVDAAAAAGLNGG